MLCVVVVSSSRGRVVFHFINLQFIIQRMVDGCLDCVRIWAVINSATVNMFEYVF